MAKKPNTARQDAFLVEYVASGHNRARAARKLKIPYNTVRKWFEQDEEFQRRVAEVNDEWHDLLRASLFKRAVEKSDNAAFFFLKAYDPEMYDDNVRRLKYLKDNQIADPDSRQPVTINLVRGDEPERLKKKEEA